MKLLEGLCKAINESDEKLRLYVNEAAEIDKLFDRNNRSAVALQEALAKPIFEQLSFTEAKGILSIPSDKRFHQMPQSHYIRLVEKHGYAPVMKALGSIKRYNGKNMISEHADRLLSELRNIYRKKEKELCEMFMAEELLLETHADQEIFENAISELELFDVNEDTDTPYKMKFNDYLELPKNKKTGRSLTPYYEMPDEHYDKLIKKKGYQRVVNAIHNLYVLFKNRKDQTLDGRTLGRAARDMLDHIKDKFERKYSRDFARKAGKPMPELEKEAPAKPKRKRGFTG